MAIYNIDNIRSINEDKSDIREYDSAAKYFARMDSKEGHQLKSDGFYPKGLRRALRRIDSDQYEDKYERKVVAGRTNPYSRDFAQTALGKSRYDYVNNRSANEHLDKDRLNKDIDKARIERKLKESKAKQAKLKEAAQYILDILDEQEYNNSNDYYYYE